MSGIRMLLTHLTKRRPAPRSCVLTRPSLESLESRVVLYTASGNAWPAPALITLSFMPDNTLINGKPSTLVSAFNAKFGANNWEKTIERAAQSWAAATNINFAVVADSGAANGTGSYQQGDPTFGDVRVGGYNFNSTTLAQAYMPPPVNNYSIAGDVTFNTGQAFGSTYDLYTVAVHEIGHALGLDHSGVHSAEMYGSYNGVKNALTGDDALGIQSLYSGARVPDGNDAYGPNDSLATANNVNPAVNGSTLTGLVTGLDITTVSDVDIYKVTVPSGTDGTMSVSAVSAGLSLLSPRLTLMDVYGTTLATASTVGAYGTTVTATVGGVFATQTYYMKVQGAEATVLGTGSYALTLNFGYNANPAVPVPYTTRPNGNPLSAGGGQADTPVRQWPGHAESWDTFGPASVRSASAGPARPTWAAAHSLHRHRPAQAASTAGAVWW